MYERFFGLRDLPFRLSPDPRYLYPSRKHAEALAHLRLGPTESSGFVCITGEVGIGKTTLVRAFLAGLGSEVAVAFIVDPVMSATEMLQRINREFGVAATTENRVDLVDALNAHLLDQHRNGRISIVVVDEAQALPPPLLEQLRLLSNLETSTDKLLRIVLVGQPQLRATLRDPALAQLNQRITLRWHIGPLSSRETVAYVRHRLAVASGDDRPAILTRPAVWLVHRLAGGIPRLINMIAHRALLAAYTERSRAVGLAQVVRAYREIAAVPLPRRRRLGIRASFAAATAAVVVVASLLGMPRLWARPSAAPVEPAHATIAVARDASAPVPALATLEDLRARLGAVSEAESRRAALDAILVTWHEQPLDPEAPLPIAVEAAAKERHLDTVAFSGTLRMLRAFDLPAILELQLEGVAGRRHAALVQAGDDTVTIAIGGEPIITSVATLVRAWLGRAELVWRDFDDLGQTFGRGASGPKVESLQRLLRLTGHYSGPTTPRYDGATDDALLRFQGDHMLAVDGLVGRMTRIALYTVAGGFRRPTLTEARS